MKLVQFPFAQTTPCPSLFCGSVVNGLSSFVWLIVGLSIGLFSCQNPQSGDTNSEQSNLLTIDTLNLPVTQITSGAKQHWFGYYDKWQIDPTGRYALGMQVDTIFRSPTAMDTVRIGIIDLQNNNQWKEIGTSTSWGWQQGCMLQWISGSTDEVIWNDRLVTGNGEKKFVSHIYKVSTGERRTLPKAIYAVSQDGTFAVGTEFNRIQDMRPGYGYPGIMDPYASEKAPSAIGIYNMDLKTGESKLIIPLSEIAAIPNQEGPIPDKYFHYFNHLLVSPDSKRLIFLHRYREEKPVPGSSGSGFITRMFTANVDGSGIYLLDPSGKTSHFIWKDSQSITAWTTPSGEVSGFYEFQDQTDQRQLIGKEAMPVNGHNTYIPNTNNEWILNDTYPDKADQKQTLYLYHVPTNRKVVIGRFFKPDRLKGEWRCDLHPRTSQDGKFVFFDSSHEGDKRQMYRINIEKVISL